MTEEDRLEMHHLAHEHAESEGDNGNAELSFMAGYAARETQLESLRQSRNDFFERAMENGQDLLEERARTAKLIGHFREIDEILSVPAAEYVPAISNAFAVIDKAVAEYEASRD